MANKTGLGATVIGVASAGGAGWYALQMLGGSYPINSETITHAVAFATTAIGSLGVAGGIYWCETACLAVLWVLAGNNTAKRDALTAIASMPNGDPEFVTPITPTPAK